MTTPRRSSSGAAPETQTRAPARRGHGNAGSLIILGFALLGFALLVITLQTQTNEAAINGTQHVDIATAAQWSIWLQIPKLMFGESVPGPDVKPGDLPGIIIGQGVELVYIALITGREIAMHTSNTLGRLFGTIVVIVLVVICIFDFYADLIYGDVPTGTHVAFAVFCTLVVGFFPTWGLSLIEHGWKRL